MQEQNEKYTKEIETIKKNKKQILELKIPVSKLKNNREPHK